MSARRLLTAAVAFVWLLPTLVAGAVALHVAFEHPVGHAHEATPAAVELRVFVAQGQLDAARHLPHEHSTVADNGGVAIRRGVDAAARPSIVASAEIAAPWVDSDDPAPFARVLAGPPKASGPPLLARLSIFRI